MGTDIRGKWLLCGSQPGEPKEIPELGIDAPKDGLYVREDVDLRCNFMMTSFIKRNLQKAHGALLERLIVGVGIIEEQAPSSPSSYNLNSQSRTSPMLQRASMQQIVEHRLQPANADMAPFSPSSVYSPRAEYSPHLKNQYAHQQAGSPSTPIELPVPSEAQYVELDSSDENSLTHPGMGFISPEPHSQFHGQVHELQ